MSGRISELLDRIGWSDAELAARLDVAVDTARQWRTERRTPPATVEPWLDQIAAGVESAGRVPPGWAGVKSGRRASS